MDMNLNNILDKLALNNLPYMEMSGGFLIGLATGYAIKKSIKLLLFFLGIVIILLFILEHQHIISIDKQGLEHNISNWWIQLKEFVIFLKYRVSQYHTSSKLSALTGFIIGIKAG